MQGKIKKLKNSNNEYAYPVTVSDAVFVDSTKSLKTKLQEMDTAISSAGSGSTGGTNNGVTASNLVVGGNVRLSVDFTAKTISFTTWNLWTTNAAFTLAAGTKTFSAEIGTSTFYYVCYKNNTIELVTAANIGTYTGIVLFGIMNTSVFPFAYPVHLIGVKGGMIYNKSDISIGEWFLIGDSLTQGQSWWVEVQKQYPIPTIINSAVAGRRMAGSGGMWVEKDNIPTTAELCTIMGGTNDQSGSVPRGSILPVDSTFDTGTFIGAYQTLIEGLLVRVPKLRIILMTPPRAWTDTNATTLRSGLKDYGDDVKALGQFYNLPVIDMYNNMGYNEKNQKTYLTDGLHWTVDGQKRVASLVCGALREYY